MRCLQLAAAGLAALATLTPACSSEPAGPEARVRALLERAELAAEARDVGALRDAISERYRDADGRDKAALKALLGFHFLRNQSVHLLVRIGSVALPAPGRAEVVAFAAMAGRPIPGAEALAAVRADLFRFDLALQEEDGAKWRVVAAEWRRASRSDFY